MASLISQIEANQAKMDVNLKEMREEITKRDSVLPSNDGSMSEQ
jgi:hypothetical protein